MIHKITKPVFLFLLFVKAIPRLIYIKTCRLNRLIGVKNLNEFTFTKSLAERFLRKERGHIPLVIVRLPLVTAAAYEPSPGWIDNVQGTAGRSHNTVLPIA